MLGFNGGAIGADIYCDRAGILARTIGDCAKVLDALRNPDGFYYDPRDPYTTVPRSSVLPSYAEHARASGTSGALKGMRIGVIRESMLVRPGETATVPICTAVATEIKAMLGDRLGATLVESSDPLWERDRDLAPMNPDFRRALAQLVPVFMPDLLFRLGPDGTPLFKEFAAAIRPTEFAPDKVFGNGTLAPIDYCVALAEGHIDAARQSRHRDDPAAGIGAEFPLPYPAISRPARRRLAGARLHRDPDRFRGVERVLEILGR